MRSNSIAVVAKFPPETVKRLEVLEQLRQAWKESGLSQQQIADDLGVTQGAVSQWMQGRRPVPAEKATSLGKLLDRRPEEISHLYLDLLSHFPAASTASPSRPKVDHDLEALLALATPTSRTQIKRIAQAAADGRLTEKDVELLRLIADRFAKPS